MESFNAMEGKERKEAERLHSCMPEHRRHKPFNPPLFQIGTNDMSADVLHLVFINMFTFFFEMTILVHVAEFEPDARLPIEIYLRHIGLPVKLVKANGVQEMKQSLTGRDAKTIISQSLVHIPVLLEYAHADQKDIHDAVHAAAAAQGENNVDNEDDFTWDGEGEDRDGSSDDDDCMPRILRDARSWDRFRALCHAMRPFEQDDAQYREQRAVETFNAAGLVMAEYKRLNPQSVSACPHVALCVVPRQMVELGDPGRRGTDHSESYGASIKESIHRRCLRRRKGLSASQHHRRNAKGEVVKSWTQRALSVSRIMQTFRDQSVRERVMRDEESVPYLMRHHYRLIQAGKHRLLHRWRSRCQRWTASR